MPNEKTETVLSTADWNEGDGIAHLDVVHTASKFPNGAVRNSIRLRALVTHLGSGIKVELPSMDRRVVQWFIEALEDAKAKLGPEDSWTHTKPEFVVGRPPG